MSKDIGPPTSLSHEADPEAPKFHLVEALGGPQIQMSPPRSARVQVCKLCGSVFSIEQESICAGRLKRHLRDFL
jgi:hypothetical protein